MDLFKYRILNVDETGRFWIDDYEIPLSYNVSKPFDTLEEAIRYADQLKETERYRYDLIYEILGIYIKDQHYPQVVYKCFISFS